MLWRINWTKKPIFSLICIYDPLFICFYLPQFPCIDFEHSDKVNRQRLIINNFDSTFNQSTKVVNPQRNIFLSRWQLFFYGWPPVLYPQYQSNFVNTTYFRAQGGRRQLKSIYKIFCWGKIKLFLMATENSAILIIFLARLQGKINNFGKDNKI